MNTTTTKNGKAGHPTKSKPANDHDGKCTSCTCGKQQIPMTRKDIFAAVALHGMLATAHDHKDIFRLCVENGCATATTCYTMGHHMEQAAQMKGGCR